MHLPTISHFPTEASIKSGKRILVLMTGGYDSTYILNALMSKDIANIDVLHLQPSFIGAKARYEERAINAIVAELKATYPDNRFTIKEVFTSKTDVWAGHMRDSQAAMWPALTAGFYDPAKHDCVVLGYNYDDTGNSNVESVVKLWETMFDVSFPEEPPLKLYLPLLHHYKNNIIDGMPPNLAKHVWTCEGISRDRSKTDFTEACGECNKCQELLSILAAHPNTARYILAQPAHQRLPSILLRSAQKVSEDLIRVQVGAKEKVPDPMDDVITIDYDPKAEDNGFTLRKFHYPSRTLTHD